MTCCYRVRLDKYMQAARLRLRELDVHYRAAKRELRRARRTVKTYEAMVALGKLPAAAAADGAVMAHAATAPQLGSARVAAVTLPQHPNGPTALVRYAAIAMLIQPGL
jgi:hypothetical protein